MPRAGQDERRPTRYRVLNDTVTAKEMLHLTNHRNYPRAAVAALLLLCATSCLGTLTESQDAQLVAETPGDELDLPLHDSGKHWLLRGESGWCGAHEALFGGDPHDAAVATVRAAVMRDVDAAARGFERLTGTYIYSLLRSRMNDVPEPVEYPDPLDGDDITVLRYPVRLPPVYAPEFVLMGQMTAVRAGRVVLMIESIGVRPEHLVPAVRELVRAAYRLPASGC